MCQEQKVNEENDNCTSYMEKKFHAESFAN